MVDTPSWLTIVLNEWVSYPGGHHDGLTTIDGAKRVEGLTQSEVE